MLNYFYCSLTQFSLHSLVRRKDDPMQKLLQSPCYEDVFWKSYASAELLAQLEVYHHYSVRF